MKAARAKVVKGKIVTRAKFPEGARLTILMDDERPPIQLAPDDEAAMLRGIESIKAGRGIPLAECSSAAIPGTSSSGITGTQGPTRWREDGSSPSRGPR